MDYEKAYCPECDEGIAGHQLEWVGSSRHSPKCPRCGDGIDVSEMGSISREGPHIHSCPSCGGVLGITSPVDSSVEVFCCPRCMVVLGIEGR